MTKTRRDMLKRRVAQAYNAADKSIGLLAELYVDFKEVHPEHADVLAVVGANLAIGQELMLAFWKATWGSTPRDITQWSS